MYIVRKGLEYRGDQPSRSHHQAWIEATLSREVIWSDRSLGSFPRTAVPLPPSLLVLSGGWGSGRIGRGPGEEIATEVRHTMGMNGTDVRTVSKTESFRMWWLIGCGVGDRETRQVPRVLACV